MHLTALLSRQIISGQVIEIGDASENNLVIIYPPDRIERTYTILFGNLSANAENENAIEIEMNDTRFVVDGFEQSSWKPGTVFATSLRGNEKRPVQIQSRGSVKIRMTGASLGSGSKLFLVSQPYMMPPWEAAK